MSVSGILPRNEAEVSQTLQYKHSVTAAADGRLSVVADHSGAVLQDCQSIGADAADRLPPAGGAVPPLQQGLQQGTSPSRHSRTETGRRLTQDQS